MINPNVIYYVHVQCSNKMTNLNSIIFQGLEKAMASNIEQDITMKVKSVEAKSFHVIQAPSTSDVKSKSSDSAKTKKK